MINLLKSIIFIFILGFIFSGCSHKLEVSDSYMEPHINKKAQKVEDFISSVSILENKSNPLPFKLFEAGDCIILDKETDTGSKNLRKNPKNYFI